MLLEERRVHPVIDRWARKLKREPAFEEFYRRLGYKNLAWFR